MGWIALAPGAVAAGVVVYRGGGLPGSMSPATTEAALVVGVSGLSEPGYNGGCAGGGGFRERSLTCPFICRPFLWLPLSLGSVIPVA